MEIIRKYSNRKLYSESTSRYVTLGDLVVRIQQNLPFQVIDHNGKDVTQHELAMIVTQQCFNKIESIPESTLKSIILSALGPSGVPSRRLPGRVALASPEPQKKRVLSPEGRQRMREHMYRVHEMMRQRRAKEKKSA